MCIFLCFDTIRRKRILTDAVVIKCAYGLHSYGIFGHFVLFLPRERRGGVAIHASDGKQEKSSALYLSCRPFSHLFLDDSAETTMAERTYGFPGKLPAAWSHKIPEWSQKIPDRQKVTAAYVAAREAIGSLSIGRLCGTLGDDDDEEYQNMCVLLQRVRKHDPMTAVCSRSQDAPEAHARRGGGARARR